MSLLQDLFINILNMSITASYVAIAVILVRLLLKKVPKIFSYILWVPVLFRLVCPFSFDSAFSFFNLINLNAKQGGGAYKFVPQNIGLMQTPAIRSAIGGIGSAVNASLPAAIPEASVNPMQIWMDVFSLIWILGVITLLIYSIVSYVKIKRKLQTTTRVDGNVFETDAIGTAFVCGFIRPKIYVPANIGDANLSYILEHERTHIRRKDYIIKPIAFLALILHWFNPLMWLCFALMSRDMEMSCDESVMQRLGDSAKGGYSGSLLTLSVKRKGLLAANPLAFGESYVKARIKNVLDYKKPAFWVASVSVIIVLGVGIAMISNPNIYDVDLSSENPGNDPSDIVFQQKEQEEIQIETSLTNAGDRSQDQYSSADDEENTRTLLSEPVEDKVCLGLFITEQIYPESYYVLDDEAQKKLIPMLSNLKKRDVPDGIYKDRFYLGINIVYQGLEWQILSDGSLYHFSSSRGEGFTEYYVVNKELCKIVLEIAARDLGIVPFDPTTIKNVTSAELMLHKGDRVYKQTITDSVALFMMEKLFSEAEIIKGGTGCPFTGIMTLTLDDGQQIKLAMATDSCCVYFVNGIYFDYKPAEVRGKEDGIHNNIIFDYFDKIPLQQ